MNRITRAYLVRYRREASSVLAGLAALLVVNMIAPLHSHDLVVTTKELPLGHIIGAGDVRLTHSTVTWEGALSNVGDVIGRTTSRSITSGEPLGLDDTLGPSLLQDRTRVAVTVSVDAADAAMIRAGDIVDVLSTESRCAGSARVLSATVAARGMMDSGSSHVTVAVLPREAEAIAAARGGQTFMLALHAR